MFFGNKSFGSFSRGAISCLLFVLLTICGFGQSLSTVSVSPSSINGGSTASGTVTLTKAAPTGGFIVNLTSSQSFASVPASVTIPAGSLKAHFTVSTIALSSSKTAVLTATANKVTRSFTFTVTSAPLYLVTVFPQTIAGGSVTIGTVSLDGVAPYSGTTVSLSTNSHFASVPSSVTVPSGYTFTTFLVTTSPVFSKTNAVITAKLGRTVRNASLEITPAFLGSFTIAPSAVAGGQTSFGTVSLTGTAPKGGFKVSLSSSNTGAAKVPSSVVVPAGATFTTFNITTANVNPSASVEISASAEGIGLSQTLQVEYLNLKALSIAPTTVIGGGNATGTVGLTGPAPSGGYSVELSTNSGGVTVPSSVWIPAGASIATFPIQTSPVAVNTPVTVTAASGASYTTATLNVSAATVSALTFSLPSIAGGSSVVGTIGLTSPAPAGLTVNLTSSDPSLTVPASVTFAVGATAANFTATSIPVAVDTPVNVVAGENGTSVTGSVSVYAPRLLLLTLNPSVIIGGLSTSATVSLTSPAPAGFSAAISSSNPLVTVPTSVTFPAGTTFGTFPVTSSIVTTNQSVFVNAVLNGISLSGTLNLLNGLSSGQGLDTNSPWPKFHGDAQNTGQTSNAMPSTDWAAVIGSPINSTPAVGLDGTVYVGANNGYIYAINPLTGAIIWQVKTSARVASSPVISSKGILYVGSSDHCLYAINISNGGIIWKYLTGGAITSTPALGADGNVYFGSYDGYVYSLNQATGTLIWTVKTHGPIESSPTLSVDGTLFIGSDDFNIYAIDTVLVSVKWTYLTNGAVASSPALANGMAYFGSDDGNVYAISSINGSLVWSQPTNWSVSSSPCVDSNGNVYVGSFDSNLYAFNGLSGAVLWTYKTGDSIESSPAVDKSGNVYVGSDDGKIVDIATATGALVYGYTEGSELRSSPIIAGTSTVLFGTSDGSLLHKNLSISNASGWSKFHGNNYNTGLSAGFGATGFQKWATSNVGGTSSPTIGADGTIYSSYLNNLYAVNYKTGVIEWVYQASSSWTASSPAVGSDGTLFLGSGDNGLYAINGRTGTLKWRFATSSQIVSCPVVGPDGTVYVGSNDGNVYAVNGQTGVQKWKFTTNAAVESSPALSAGGILYIGSDDSNLYAVNTQTGGLVWVFGTGNKVQSSPAIGPDGTVYVGSSDTNVYALNGLTGALIWTFGTGNKVVSSPAIGIDGTVYITSTDGYLYSVNGKNANLNWQVNSGSAITSSPILASDGTVYFGFNYAFGDAKNFFAINGFTGKTIWSMNIPTLSASPAIGIDGTIYVGSILGTSGNAVSSLIAIH